MKKELKTLKDIETFELNVNVGSNEKIIYSKDLKAEAVKWVKDDFKLSPRGRESFIEFFNLTEEDLKEGGKNE